MIIAAMCEEQHTHTHTHTAVTEILLHDTSVQHVLDEREH